MKRQQKYKDPIWPIPGIPKISHKIIIVSAVLVSNLTSKSNSETAEPDWASCSEARILSIASQSFTKSESPNSGHNIYYKIFVYKIFCSRCCLRYVEKSLCVNHSMHSWHEISSKCPPLQARYLRCNPLECASPSGHSLRTCLCGLRWCSFSDVLCVR